MIWLILLAASVPAMAPLMISLLWRARLRGRRDAAMALHRAQLVELDRDLADGKLPAAEHAAAQAEIGRRLLAAAAEADADAGQGSARPILFAALPLLPAAGLALYLINGDPGMPSVPWTTQHALEQKSTHQADLMIGLLRERLRQLDPKSEQAREGYVLLGNIEASRAHWQAAGKAWQAALAVKFDATLAAETGEAISVGAGHLTPEAAALFRRALAEAPPNAPWRAQVQARLKQSPQ